VLFQYSVPARLHESGRKLVVTLFCYRVPARLRESGCKLVGLTRTRWCPFPPPPPASEACNAVERSDCIPSSVTSDAQEASDGATRAPPRGAIEAASQVAAAETAALAASAASRAVGTDVCMGSSAGIAVGVIGRKSKKHSRWEHRFSLKRAAHLASCALAGIVVIRDDAFGVSFARLMLVLDATVAIRALHCFRSH
jgi:hypothetical protein